MKWLCISVLWIPCLLTVVVKANDQQKFVYVNFVKHTNTLLYVAPIISTKLENITACIFTCLKHQLCLSLNVAVVPVAGLYDCQLLAVDKYNSSDNLTPSKDFDHYSIESPCDSSPCQNGGSCRPLYETQEYKCDCASGFSGAHCEKAGFKSCGEMLSAVSELDGVHKLLVQQQNFAVYCDMTEDKKGWTLIARFSNNDTKNWMKNSGEYWYDLQSAVGQTTNPADNTDMISPAFWLVAGTEFKITRSDDPEHTALLHSTGECLGGQTFRSKVTSYGDFRNSKVWASDECLGRCDVQYGGQFSDTDGFNEAECDGALQQRNKIGFWCDYEGGDGAVMTIGGAGGSDDKCERVAHGIGVTDADEASFAHDQHGDVAIDEDEFDFGPNARSGYTNNIPPYSLNIWVR